MDIVKIMLGDNIDVDKFNHMLEIYNQEKDTLIRNKIKGILSTQFELEELGSTLANLKKLRDDKNLLLKQFKAKADNNLHVFITVNLKPGATLDDLKTKTEKLCRRQCFVEPAFWVYEQRGGTVQTMGNGIHAHILHPRS